MRQTRENTIFCSSEAKHVLKQLSGGPSDAPRISRQLW